MNISPFLALRVRLLLRPGNYNRNDEHINDNDDSTNNVILCMNVCIYIYIYIYN